MGFSIGKTGAKELRRGLICSDIKNDPARETATFIAQVKTTRIKRFHANDFVHSQKQITAYF